MSGVREWDRSPFEDGPPPAAGPAGSSSAPPPTERLTVGRATLVVAPLTDVDLLPEYVRSIASIPGISRVEVDAFDGGEAVLTVTTTHPVLLTGELRRVLAGRVRSCTPAGPGGRVVVDARAPLPPPPPPTPDPPASDGRDPANEGGGPGADAGPDGAFGPEDDAAGTVDGEASTSDWSASWAPGGRTADGATTGERDAADRDRTDEGPEEHRAGRTRFGWGRGARGRHGRRDDDAGSASGSAGPDGAAGPGSSSSGPRGAGGWTTADAGGRIAAPPPEAVAAALAGAVDETPGLSVLVFDRELRVRAVAGVTPEDGDGSLLIGRPVVHAFAPDARRPLASALEAALQGGERTIPLPDADGDEHLRVTCRPAAPDSRLGVCVVRDVDVHGASSLLVEATRAFEITFRHSPIGQGLLSPTGHWLRVNGALAELLGRPGDELVGEESVDAMHPDDRADERERLRVLLAGDEDHYVVGSRFLHVDGHVVRTHTRMTRIADEEGVTRGFVAQVVDAAAWRRFRDG